MKELQRIATEIYEENLGTSEEVTWEEALEMAKMEVNAKKDKRYEKSDTPRKAKERKVDNEKKYLLELLISAINQQNCIDSIKNEAEFSFTFNENSYTVKLIKHRAVK